MVPGGFQTFLAKLPINCEILPFHYQKRIEASYNYSIFNICPQEGFRQNIDGSPVTYNYRCPYIVKYRTLL